MDQNINNELKKINTKIDQLNYKNKLLIQKQKHEARKQRTRRLIQKGALLEHYFECENLTMKETENLLLTFADYVIKNKPQKFRSDK